MQGQNTQHPFTDSGFSDIETAVVLFDMMKLDAENLKTVDSLKLREIAEFIEGYPDGLFVAQNVLRKRQNPDISPVDYLSQYVGLRKSLMELKNKQEQLKSEIEFYE
jgi:hypothetical protein